MSQRNSTKVGGTESRNPFCLGPVELPPHFCDREAEIRSALNFLHKRQCVSVVGPAKIGKTSFALHLAHPRVRARRKRAEDHVFVYVDGHAMAASNEAACYLYIREETIQQITREVVVDEDVRLQLEEMVRPSGSQTAYYVLRTLIRSARQLGIQLVIILDHLDALNQNRLLSQVFFSALRSLHTSYQVAYLAVSQSPIDRLERICPDGPGSPFFNIFHQISIDPFEDDES